MNIEWQLFTNVNSEVSVNKIIKAVTKKMSVPISESKTDPNNNDGFIINLTTPIDEDSWSSAVVKSLAVGQQIGRTWHLAGNIENEVDAWSNDSVVSGITSLHMMLLPDKAHYNP